MNGFLALFQAERIKWRRSWALLAALLAPMLQVGFLILIAWYSDERIRVFRPAYRFWFEINAMAWNLLVMPMTTALLTELSWGLEAESKAWSRTLAQPVSIWKHYVVKGLSHLSLLMISFVILIGLELVGAWALSKNQLLLFYMGEPPWRLFMFFGLYSLAAAIPVLAFHTWLSLRVPGFWTALAVASLGTWICVQLVGRTPWLQCLPWGLSSQMALTLERLKPIPWSYIPGALVCAICVFVLGCFMFQKIITFYSNK